MARSARRSTTGAGWSVCEPHSKLDYILLVVIRIFYQVADRGGVRRLLLREVFQQHELLVFDLGNMNVEDTVMGRRIDGHLARGRVDADSGFERLDHLQAVDA